MITPGGITPVAGLSIPHQAAAGGGSPYNAAVLADSPAGFWPMNESAGTTAVDATGNGHAGTYTGGVTLGQPGPCSDGQTAPVFNGTSGYVTVPSAAALQPLDPMTLEIWVNPTSVAGYCWMIFKGPGSTATPFEWRLDAISTGQARLQTNNIIVDSIAATANAWTHLAVTISAGTQTNYHNGVPTTTGTASMSGTGADAVLFGTRGDFNTFWPGKFAKVAIYGTALSAARIAAHYAAR